MPIYSNPSTQTNRAAGIAAQRAARWRVLAVASALWASFCTTVLAQSESPVAAPAPPAQPARGPGSLDYPHAGLDMSRHGAEARTYWLFTPKDPQPNRAPIIVFLHGWGATEPTTYGAWIKHLVRRGNIVIFPRYQENLRTRPGTFVTHAAAAVRDAIRHIQEAGAISPDLDRFALVGHSMGAIMSANIAQTASQLGLPRPRALFLAEPAFEPLVGKYEQVDPNTRIVVAVAAEGKRDKSAARILNGTVQVPDTHKNFVAIPSDSHGNPPLISDHFSPCAADVFDSEQAKSPRQQWRGMTRDALDYYGYWKLCDGLLDATFRGEHAEYALFDSPELRFMGRWSDGTLIEPASVLEWTPHASSNTTSSKN